jgi:hypothetical protein
MRRLILAATAIAALAVPAVVPAVSAAKPTLPPTTIAVDGGTYGDIPGNFIVPAGVTAKIEWGTVQGNTTVQGTLNAAQATFVGNVDVNGGHFSGFNGGFVAKNNVTIQNVPANSPGNGWHVAGFWSSQPPYFQPGGSEIDGNLSFLNNGGDLYVEGPTTVQGNFTYSGNAVPYSGGLTVVGHSTIS